MPRLLHGRGRRVATVPVVLGWHRAREEQLEGCWGCQLSWQPPNVSLPVLLWGRGWRVGHSGIREHPRLNATLPTEHEITMLSWLSCKHPWQKAHEERFVFSPRADQCVGGHTEPHCSWGLLLARLLPPRAVKMGTPQVTSSGCPYLLVTEGLPTSC